MKNVWLIFCLFNLPILLFSEEPVDIVPGSIMVKFIDAELSVMSPSEIETWAASLGLDLKDPKESLRAYYGKTGTPLDSKASTDAEKPTENPPSTKKKQNIKIKRSNELSYYTVDEINEKFMRVSGGVLLEIEDKAKDSTHIIEADQVIISRDTDFMSARGNIHYTRKSKGKDESFDGDDLLFNSNTYESWMIGVKSEVKNDKDRQKYTARYAYKTDKNISILTNVDISASVWDPPAYHIHANKLFLLSGGEWYLENAVLYVGEIPVFYFPAFFNPSDELVFHPNIGSHDQYGAYVQTTTYIIGQKTGKSGLIDALKISIPEEKSSQTGLRYELEGLFLKPKKSEVQTTEKTDKIEDSEGILKIILDAYARMGFIAAFQYEDDKVGALKGLKILGGIAYSKNIYLNSGQYTNYLNQAGVAVERISGSNFLGVNLPIRFFLDIKGSVALDKTEISVNLPIYSDSTVWSDFANRNEEMDWSKLLKLKTQNLNSSPESAKTNLNFTVFLKNSIEMKLFPEWLTSLNLNKAEMRLGLTNISPGGIDVLDSNAAKTSNAQVFVPNQIFLPSIGFTVIGKFSTSPKLDGQKGSDLIPPWSDSEEKDGSEKQNQTEDLPYLYPEFLPAISQTTPTKIGGLAWNLDYAITPNLDILGTFMDNTGVSITNINNNIRSWTFASSIIGNIKNEIKSSDFITLSNEIIIREAINTSLFLNEDLSQTEKTDILNAEAKTTLFSLEQVSSFSFYPLVTINDFKKSSIIYKIGTNIYTYKFSSILGLDPQFSTNILDGGLEDFKEHSLNALLTYNPNKFLASIESITNLPPIAFKEELIASMTFTDSWFYFYLKGGVKFTDLIPFSFTDLKIDSHIDFISSNPDYRLGTVMLFDLNLSNIKTMDTVLKLGVFSGEIHFSNNAYLSYDSNTASFKTDAETSFKIETFGFSAKPVLEIEPTWKNRVNFKVSPSLEYNQNIVDVRTSSLTAGLDLEFSIFELLDLKLSLKSKNNRMYRYFDSLSDRVGLQAINIFEDLFNSFDFSNNKNRQNTAFKFQSILIETTHKMGDWDLKLRYSTSPIEDRSNNTIGFKWISEFSFDISWKPLPLVKTILTANNDGVTVE